MSFSENVNSIINEFNLINSKIVQINEQLCQFYWNGSASKKYLEIVNQIKENNSILLSQLNNLSLVGEYIKEIQTIDKTLHELELEKNNNSNNITNMVLKPIKENEKQYKLKRIDDLLYDIEINKIK